MLSLVLYWLQQHPHLGPTIVGYRESNRKENRICGYSGNICYFGPLSSKKDGFGQIYVSISICLRSALERKLLDRFPPNLQEKCQLRQYRFTRMIF